MLEALKFTQGAVARKDYVPSLTHFRIENRRIYGFNGSIALSSPIDLDLTLSPKAVPFVKAIQTCKDTVQLHMTTAGRLSVKSGGFRAYIDCTDEPYPDVQPEGDIVPLVGTALLGVLKKLSPFVAEDDSRRWARGILLRGQSAIATNNVVIVEHWLDTRFPVEINIPKVAVQEILRIGEEPCKLQVCDTSITFHYADGRWLRSQLYSTKWPDIAKVFDTQWTQPVPLTEAFFAALADLRPFVDETSRVFLSADGITTSQDETGASISLPQLGAQGVYNIDQLLLLAGTAEEIDWTGYPKPCLFYGGQKIRGAVVGMRS